MGSAEDESVDGSEWLHHLLWEVSGQTALLANAVFDDTALTPALVGILDEIAREPGTTIAKISRRVPSAPQSVRQVVERLERLAYIDRRVSGGRGIGLHLTEAGAEAREMGHGLEVELHDRMRSYLPDAAYDDLVSLLRQAREDFAPHVDAIRGARRIQSR